MRCANWCRRESRKRCNIGDVKGDRGVCEGR